ncbi:MAG: energy-coupled thiamine transporter ThiT [Clostridia bacterium]|nr:energy-coupled thiamine transporter ThiT [Clostridia bacterium]
MFNLLSVFGVIDDTASKPLIIVSAIVIAISILILIAFSFRKKTFETKTLVFAGLTIATSFVLSFIKVKPVTYGGSITLCSMFAISLFAYCFGFLPALLVGIIYGFLQFFEGGAYIFNLATFFLDYIFAFSSIVMMPLARKLFKGNKAFIIGLSLTFLLRFIFHFTSGILYFVNGGIWANLPQDNAFIYSLLYQVTYLVPDYLLCLIVTLVLSKTKTLNKLVCLIEK